MEKKLDFNQDVPAPVPVVENKTEAVEQNVQEPSALLTKSSESPTFDAPSAPPKTTNSNTNTPHKSSSTKLDEHKKKLAALQEQLDKMKNK